MSALTLFRRLFLAALLAGLCAGLVGWAARQAIVVPLILQAEVYEQAAHDAAGHAAHGHDDAAEWRPADGAERLLFTLATDVLAAIAFALLLASAVHLSGTPIDAWRGLAWGCGGYVAVCLAPSLSLPPELPGTESGALLARQVWWAFTVLATAAGLLLARFAPRFAPRFAWYGVAVVLVLLPHLIGAPAAATDGHGHGPPAELARRFVAAVLIANALLWAVLGAATGYLQRRVAAASAFPA